jgi:TonB-dependent SusC/RagA subfamily outer membrane receptor
MKSSNNNEVVVTASKVNYNDRQLELSGDKMVINDQAGTIKISGSPSFKMSNKNGEQPLYVVDGKIASGQELENLRPEQIQSIDVLKGSSAIAKYGDKGKNGVVLVTIKKEINKLYVAVEQSPTFDGDFATFLNTNLKYPENAQETNAQGVVLTQFIVDTNGNISQVKLDESSKCKQEDLVAESIRLINLTNGKWKPAIQNGKAVTAYHQQPITYVVVTEE